MAISLISCNGLTDEYEPKGEQCLRIELRKNYLKSHSLLIGAIDSGVKGELINPIIFHMLFYNLVLGGSLKL